MLVGFGRARLVGGYAAAARTDLDVRRPNDKPDR